VDIRLSSSWEVQNSTTKIGELARKPSYARIDLTHAFTALYIPRLVTSVSSSSSMLRTMGSAESTSSVYWPLFNTIGPLLDALPIGMVSACPLIDIFLYSRSLVY